MPKPQGPDTTKQCGPDRTLAPPVYELPAPLALAFDTREASEVRTLLPLVRQTGPRRRALQTMVSNRIGFALGRGRQLELAEVNNLTAAWKLLEKQVADLGWTNLRAVAQLPRQVHRQRATVFLFAADDLGPGKPSNSRPELRAVAKLALDSGSTTALGREVATAGLDLTLSTGYQRSPLLVATILTNVGSAIWEAASPSSCKPSKLKVRDLAISFDNSARETGFVYPDWDPKVLDLIERHARPNVRTAAIDGVQQCIRKPIHGDFTASNVIDGANGSTIIDWENFHPAGPALTDVVSQLIDHARSSLRPTSSLRQATESIEGLPWGESLAGVGYLAVHGDPFAKALLEQLLTEPPSLVDVSEGTLDIQRNKQSHAATQS